MGKFVLSGINFLLPSDMFILQRVTDCAITIRRGGSKTRGGAQCKLTALGDGNRYISGKVGGN